MSLRKDGRSISYRGSYCSLPYGLKLSATEKGSPVLPWTFDQENPARLLQQDSPVTFCWMIVSIYFVDNIYLFIYCYLFFDLETLPKGRLCSAVTLLTQTALMGIPQSISDECCKPLTWWYYFCLVSVRLPKMSLMLEAHVLFCSLDCFCQSAGCCLLL